MDITDLHQFIGLAVASVFLALSIWGLVSWIRNRDPGASFWRLLATGQVGLGLQVLVGAGLLLLRGGQPWLHYVYGIFPVLVLFVAHRSSKRFEGLEWAAFAVAGFFIFGLQLRGYMTGLA